MRISRIHLVGRSVTFAGTAVAVLALTACSIGAEPLTSGPSASATAPAAVPTASGLTPSELPTFGTDGACADLEQAMGRGLQSLGAIVGDPGSVEERLGEISAELRAVVAANQPEVEAARDALVAAFDELAATIRAGGQPDVGLLQEAATALDAACGG